VGRAHPTRDDACGSACATSEKAITMKRRFVSPILWVVFFGAIAEAGSAPFDLPDASRGDIEPHSIFGVAFNKNSHAGLEVGAVKWLRFDFDYSREQSKSPEAFEAQANLFDKAVEQAEKNKIMLLPILNCREFCEMYQPGRPATKNEDGVTLSTWSEWVFKVVSRYKGRVKYWEICNEPNNWKKPEVYAAMLKAAYVAGKKADPSCMFGAFSAFVELPFFEFCLKAGAEEYFDFVTIHPYQWSHSFNEQLLIGDITSLEDLLARYQCLRPIWISEIGWPTHPKGGSPVAVQGQIAAQLYLTLAGLERYKSFWYTMSDWGGDPTDAETSFGMFDAGGHPKPAFYSYYVVSKTLSSARGLGRAKLPKDFLGWHYLLKDGKEAVSVWRTKPAPARVRVHLEGLEGTQVEQRGMNLSRQTIEAKDGWVEITVGSNPVILVYPSRTRWKLAPPPPLAITPKKTNPVFITSSKPPVAFPGQKVVIPFGVANFSESDVEGVASLELPREWKVKAVRQRVTAKAGQETVGTLAFDVPSRVANGNYEAAIVFDGCRKLPFTLTTGSALAIDIAPVNQPLADKAVRLKVMFANQGGQKLDGKLTMAVAGATIGPDAAVTLDLAPGQSMTVEKNISGLATNQETQVEFKGQAGSQPFALSRCIDSVYIPRAKNIKVDGGLDEWRNEPGYMIDRLEQVQQIKTWWSGPEDLSAKVMARWDEQYLYFAADVTDDLHCQRSTGGSTWMGDGFQVGFDVEGKYGYELCLAHTSQGPEIYALWTISGDVGPVKGATLVTRREGKHTYYEAAIPWTAISPLRGEPGKDVRVNFILNENDGTTREGWMHCRPGIGDSKSTATWYSWRMGK